MRWLPLFLVFSLSPFGVFAQDPVDVDVSTQDTQSSSGGQEFSSHEVYSDSNGTTTIDSSHTDFPNGDASETQKTSFTDNEGNTYSETHSSRYDDASGKWTDTHTEEGTPPPDTPEPPPVDKGGTQTEGEGNGKGVESRYGDGGVEDSWKDSSGNVDHGQWTDVDKGSSGNIYPPSKTAMEIDSVPARTIPMICQFNGLAIKGYEKSFSANPSSPMAAVRALAQARQMMDQIARYGLPKDATVSKMELKKIPWKIPLRIAGYKTEHYKILGDNRIRGEIWVVPKINIFKVMQGGKARRDLNIEHAIVPHWAKTAGEKNVFKKLVTVYREPARKNIYKTTSIHSLAGYSFKKPSVPADYKVTVLNAKDALKQAEAALKQWRSVP